MFGNLLIRIFLTAVKIIFTQLTNIFSTKTPQKTDHFPVRKNQRNRCAHRFINYWITSALKKQHLKKKCECGYLLDLSCIWIFRFSQRKNRERLKKPLYLFFTQKRKPWRPSNYRHFLVTPYLLKKTFKLCFFSTIFSSKFINSALPVCLEIETKLTIDVVLKTTDYKRKQLQRAL